MLRIASSPFQAIAHPVRRDLLEALREADSPMTVTDLGRRCEVSHSTASRHLDLLRANGLVVSRRSRTATLHALRPGAFEELADWLWAFFSDPPAVAPRRS
ncbi:winged helix-turn-helix domain-containing protein [Agromyces endophyticus]|uniref:ArsR/SmtB family transcription factor n=1 Tax=Agromyces sp. H17E-10 TaxID=2932244 RepID=UPI001FD61177|nr:winged helix-turn-helix domain-containing protein [Agromyces sp. H17E-10]UOQ90520.1 winged helix-turn-helix domain-containing protein [Agromyces sp. H17E-10]